MTLALLVFTWLVSYAAMSALFLGIDWMMVRLAWLHNSLCTGGCLYVAK